ncbi:glycosyltransferase family 4 protein [candidate division WOR-3 bacterium]|nr:glycosyltransferase family 4 protein [candidate division WOR-3 bacterium]
MKITFILPFIRLTGGIKSTFHLALELKKRGHIVKLVYPLIPLSFGYESYRYKHLKERTRKFKKALLNWKKVSWFNKIEPLLFPTPSLHNSFIPDGDVVIATAWPTAYYVYTYKSSKGKKLYYIRDYEIWSGPKNLVDSSYGLPIQKITTSSTLENILLSMFGEKIISKVPNGIDVSEFYRKPGEKNSKKKILMQYNPIPRKGLEDGMKAFEMAKRQFPEIKLVMFGYHSASPIKNRYEYHRYIYGETLRKLYSISNIFLFSSREEGWGMPPMEAMACRCPVVATSTGGIPDYTISSETCLVSPPSKPEALADNLTLLLENEELRKRIATRGEEYIKENFTWQKCAKKMEKILINLIDT